MDKMKIREESEAQLDRTKSSMFCLAFVVLKTVAFLQVYPCSENENTEHQQY